MAEHLARIFGTEEDRVNCPFYFKIGACRHGDQCSRMHNRPVASQTMILKNMYQNPPASIAMAEGQPVDDAVADEAQDHFEAFYEEVFAELTNYGEVEDMCVVDNIGDHMIGNVYVKFASEEAAERSMQKLTGRFYAGRIIQPEFCPVSEFAEARCRQYDDAQCSRGGYCNFVHWKHVPRALKRRVYRSMYEAHPEYRAAEAGGGKRRVSGPSSSGRKEEGSQREPPRRHRSRSRGGERGGAAPRRSASEERRAMIDQWNRERSAAEGGQTVGGVDESQL